MAERGPIPRFLQIWRARRGEPVVNPPISAGGREQHGTTFKLPQEALAILEPEDRKTLTTLERVCRRWDDVYSIQEGEDGEGDFYPRSIIGQGEKARERARSQLKRAAQTDPQILSPRTKVLENADGGLFAIPMNQAYAALIQEKNIIKLLEDAANKTRDRQFQTYLRLLGRSLKERDFAQSERLRQEAESLWLTRTDEPKIDLVLGFYDTNTDRLMGAKYAAEAWLTVLDENATREAQDFCDDFAVTWREMSGEPAPEFTIRVGLEKFIAGQAAKMDWRANILGSKITIFETRFQETLEEVNRYSQELMPAARRAYFINYLAKATLGQYIGHEIAHPIVANPTLETRLGDDNLWVKELASETIALDVYSHMRNVDIREKIAALVSTLSLGVREYRKVRDERKSREYYIMCTSIMNYLIKAGSLELRDGQLAWKNTATLFRDIHKLAQELLHLTRYGTRVDTQRFLDENFDENLYPHILYREPKIPDFLRKSDPPSDPNTNFPDPGPDPAIGGSRPQPKKSPSTN